MGFAEDAEVNLMDLFVQNRVGWMNNIERNIKGEMMIIKYLYFLDKPTSPKHLSSALHLSSARIAAILGSLEKKQQIIRDMDPNDRRRITVTLTKQGKKAAELQKKEIQDKIIHVFQQMGEQDTKKLIELVTTFMDYAKEMNTKERGDQA